MESTHRIDLKLLRYFLAVAEELHFGRAAARLNMSQPPLSIHIKDLEQQLGTLLFVRHSRSVALTHAGKILLEESRRLLANASQALARVEQIGRGEAGRIELGVVGTAMWGRMRPVCKWRYWSVGNWMRVSGGWRLNQPRDLPVYDYMNPHFW